MEYENDSTLIGPNNNKTNEYYQPLLGWLYLVQGLLYVTPYVPCAIAISTRPLIENSCYKIMAAMALSDISNLVIGSIIPAFYSILGLSLYEHYASLKAVGAFANLFWTAYCGLNYILAINRALDLRSKYWSVKLFGGRRTWIWIAVCWVAGGIACIVFLTDLASVTYDASVGIFFFDAMGEPWGFQINLVTHWSVAIVLPLLYLFVWLAFRWRTRQTADRDRLSSKERRIIVQAFLISFLTATTAITYVTFPVIVNRRYLFIPNCIWQLTQGANCFIYLSLNQTIRNRVLVILHLRKPGFHTIPAVNSSGSPVAVTETSYL